MQECIRGFKSLSLRQGRGILPRPIFFLYPKSYPKKRPKGSRNKSAQSAEGESESTVAKTGENKKTDAKNGVGGENGNPLKVGKRFLANPWSKDLSKHAGAQIRKEIFKDSSRALKNKGKLRKVKGRFVKK